MAIFLALSLNCGKKDLTLEKGSIRPALKSFGTSALYFTLHNTSGEDVVLTGVKASFTEHTELHETYEKDGHAGMRSVEKISLKQGESVQFKPGSLHVMFMQIQKDLVSGTEEDIILQFKTANTNTPIIKSYRVKVKSPSEK